MNAIRNIVGKLNKLCGILVGIDMVAMFLVLLVQIFVRFIAPELAIPWSMDMICFLLVIAVFLGAGVATANGKQIRLEIFADLLPGILKKIVLTIADLISIAFLVVVTSQCFHLGGENMNVIVGASPVNFGWYYIVVAVGSIIMIINFLVIIVSRFLPEKKDETAAPEGKEAAEA